MAEQPQSTPQGKACLYRQVMLRIRAGVQDGSFPPGGRLPNEAELCRMFGVSRITVRRAVAELQAEGLLSRVQGSGTYVCQPVYKLSVTQLLAPEKLLARQGAVSYTAVQVFHTRATPEQIARFGLAGQPAEMVEIRRLLCMAGQPVGQQRLIIPQVWCPADYQQAATTGESLPRLTGFAAQTLRQTLSACTLHPRQAAALGSQPGGPAFLAECLVLGRDGALYEVRWLLDAKRCRFEDTLTIDGL